MHKLDTDTFGMNMQPVLCVLCARIRHTNRKTRVAYVYTLVLSKINKLCINHVLYMSQVKREPAAYTNSEDTCIVTYHLQQEEPCMSGGNIDDEPN